MGKKREEEREGSGEKGREEGRAEREGGGSGERGKRDKGREGRNSTEIWMHIIK